MSKFFCWIKISNNEYSLIERSSNFYKILDILKLSEKELLDKIKTEGKLNLNYNKYLCEDKMFILFDFDDSEEVLQKIKLINLGEMASGIAHDINNPLGLIISGSELSKFEIDDLIKSSNDKILVGKLNSIKGHLENEIEVGASRAVEIVEGIRMFSNKKQIDFRPQCMNKIVQSSISLIKKYLRDKKITINIRNSKNIEINCKEILISQTLINLFKNASDALENFEIKDRWIDVNLFDDEDYVFIEVIDGGNGIPEEISSKIFQSYFTTKEIGKGTGLGLSLCKSYMEIHKGSLELDKSSKNTKFILKIYKHLKN